MEHLLSALEGSAVDNARIEVEGGEEMPIIDGSALGWTIQIQISGLRPAPRSADNSEPMEKVRGTQLSTQAILRSRGRPCDDDDDDEEEEEDNDVDVDGDMMVVLVVMLLLLLLMVLVIVIEW